MAVYTEVSDEDLNSFLEDYDLGTVLSFKGIAEGVENSNYIMVTEKNRFILTLYEKRVAKGDLPFFLGLMQHLAQKGLSCPTPVAQNNKKLLGTLCGRPAAIITFLEGMSVKRPSAHHCYELGKTLAAMHLKAQDFDIKRANGLSVLHWRRLLEDSASRADEVADGLQADLEKELSFLEDNWPRDLPKGVIHADLFPDNVFFLKDELSGIIDFYFACNDLLAYDVAICINAWCFESDGAFNVTKAKALLKGYEELRPLEMSEKEVLPLLARGAALRFLLTRLYDWLNVPQGALVTPKDPLEYVKKMHFHQTVNSARSYGLEF
jgi:homoserine kinase type II